MDIIANQTEDFTRHKFKFECHSFTGRESVDVSIYNFGDELHIKLWGDDNHKQQLIKCSNIIFDSILPRWLPELYLSSTFLPIKFPDWYQV